MTVLAKCEQCTQYVITWKVDTLLLLVTTCRYSVVELVPFTFVLLCLLPNIKILLTMPETVQHLSCTDNLGNTPLHVAAKHNCVSAVSLLLTKGADCIRPNHDGRTPLHLAAASGCIEYVNFMLVI